MPKNYSKKISQPSQYARKVGASKGDKYTIKSKQAVILEKKTTVKDQKLYGKNILEYLKEEGLYAHVKSLSRPMVAGEYSALNHYNPSDSFTAYCYLASRSKSPTRRIFYLFMAILVVGTMPKYIEATTAKMKESEERRHIADGSNNQNHAYIEKERDHLQQQAEKREIEKFEQAKQKVAQMKPEERPNLNNQALKEHESRQISYMASKVGIKNGEFKSDEVLVEEILHLYSKALGEDIPKTAKIKENDARPLPAKEQQHQKQAHIKKEIETTIDEQDLKEQEIKQIAYIKNKHLAGLAEVMNRAGDDVTIDEILEKTLQHYGFQNPQTKEGKEALQLLGDNILIRKNVKQVSFFSKLKFYFRLEFPIFAPPLWDKVPQNYKEDSGFMDFIQASVSLELLDNNCELIRSSLANEAYLQAAAYMEVLYDYYNFESASAREKIVIAEAIFVKKDRQYDHNFFHLLGVPMSQGKIEAQNYQSLLKVTKEFILKSGLPMEKILAQDSQGNNPLHVMAAVTPLNQFKLFYEAFADLIPEKMWNQKNNNGHSARDILENSNFQKEAIKYVAEAMKNNFNIHTSINSPSDVLHQPGSMEVHHDVVKSNEIVVPTGREKFLASYPKSAYVKQQDGNYVVMDLLNNEELEKIPASQYNEVESILPTGTSYAMLAFESRQEKLQVITKKMQKNKPSTKVESLDTSKLSQANKNNLRNGDL